MKPVIFGVEALRLSQREKRFFTRHQPAGFILFARNIETPDQVASLISELKATVPYTPLMLVDQEGGRVQRLGPPHWKALPSPASYRSKVTPPVATPVVSPCGPSAVSSGLDRVIALHSKILAAQLKPLGFNMTCFPLLDVPVDNSDPIIGDRAFSSDAQEVAFLGRIASEGLMASGILPIIKHIPGHGRAMVDSHKALPAVTSDAALLFRTDFLPFKALSDMPFAMTAHIAYSAFDPLEPATFSSVMIRDIIRDALGFGGILMSDDLSMKALSGSMNDRVAKSFAAGIDLVLHCNGDMMEMTEIAMACPAISDRLAADLADKVKLTENDTVLDQDSLFQELDNMIKEMSMKKQDTLS